MNVLFICTANKDRSRTAEIYFSNKYPGMRFRSAGINKYLSEKHGGTHLKRYMLEKADRIICMEVDHANYIISKIDKCFSDKIEILFLGDTDTYMTKNLIDALENKFKILLP